MSDPMGECDAAVIPDGDHPTKARGECGFHGWRGPLRTWWADANADVQDHRVDHEHKENHTA